jgi:hypothetical protein
MKRISGALRGVDPLTLVAAVVLVFGLAQLFAGARATGITTDEPTHTKRMASWVEYGWYVPADNLVDGRPDPSDTFATPFVYGPDFSILAHLANRVAGNESGDEIAPTADAYRVRHMVVALLAALAALAVGIAVWVLTRSKRFGLWAAAGLLAVPAWTGQGFFNLKDIPAGTGYTLVTVALLLALCEPPGARRVGYRRLGIAVLLAAGVFVGPGTRLSLWVPFLASILVYAALRIGQWRLGGIAGKRGTDIAVAAGTAIGAAAIAAAYPKAAATPLKLLVESVSNSAGYPGSAITLTAGQLVPAHPPLWYLPAWIAASYPLLLGALAVIGTIVGVRVLARSWRPPARSGLWRRPELGLVLVAQQAAMLPLAATVGGAVMYDGIRQHLYVIPALAILAGVGAAWLWAWSNRPGGRRARRRFAAIALTAALVVPMAEQTILFPFNYTYVNPVAGIGGVEGRWEGDYWQASAPEALSHVPRDAELHCAFDLIPAGAPTDVEIGYAPCYQENFEPFEYKRGTDVRDDLEPNPAAIWVIGRHRTGNQPPDECEQVDNVTRWLRGEQIVMSYVMRCPR